jgi:hypothetical protein
LSLGALQPQRTCPNDIRDQIGQFRPLSGRISLQCGRCRAESGVEQLRKGKEWHGGVLLEAAADEHHVSSVPCMGEHLASQPGFADAWLAAEQHKTPAALGNRA